MSCAVFIKHPQLHPFLVIIQLNRPIILLNWRTMKLIWLSDSYWHNVIVIWNFLLAACLFEKMRKYVIFDGRILVSVDLESVQVWPMVSRSRLLI